MTMHLPTSSVAAAFVLFVLSPGLSDGPLAPRLPDEDLARLPLAAQNGGQKQGRGGAEAGWNRGQGRGGAYPPPKAAWGVASIVLGCPTDHSVVFVIHPSSDVEAFLEYGPLGQGFTSKTPPQTLKRGSATHVTISGLQRDTAYSYRLRYREPGASEYSEGPLYGFQTQRSPGQAFVFDVQGDSHPERTPKMHVPGLYERTLLSAAKDHPDFFVCLGDDFSVDTLGERTRQSVEGVYLKQVPYLGLVGHSSPVFLVNGNHEQASKANFDGTPECLSVWAQSARNRHFAQPAPDGFYTGNAQPVDHIGLLRNYFAWTWGDAVFVVIDPYWHSDEAVDNRADRGPKRRDLWGITLGDEQYRWLERTLAGSQARYKFVFAHHVLGTGRGGVERAPYYEWGGQSAGGSWEFDTRRPGWKLPIHQLMVKTGVTIFFQGHDHVFARQELDGVVYQTAPVPADTSNTLMNGDAYQSGDKLSGAGVLRVSVGADKARVDFVRSFLPTDEKDGRKHGEVAFSYTVAPRTSASGGKAR